MADVENLEHLAKVRLFSACTDRELVQIRKASDDVAVAAGDRIVREGEVGTDFYLILEGEAVVSRAGSKVATLGPGQYFGELAVLDHAPRNATVSAATPMKLLTLGAREFSAVLDEIPGLAHKFLIEMARRVREHDATDTSH